MVHTHESYDSDEYMIKWVVFFMILDESSSDKD